MKEAVLRLFGELEQEPDTELEREVVVRLVASVANVEVLLGRPMYVSFCRLAKWLRMNTRRLKPYM